VGVPYSIVQRPTTGRGSVVVVVDATVVDVVGLVVVVVVVVAIRGAGRVVLGVAGRLVVTLDRVLVVTFGDVVVVVEDAVVLVVDSTVTGVDEVGSAAEESAFGCRPQPPSAMATTAERAIERSFTSIHVPTSMCMIRLPVPRGLLAPASPESAAGRTGTSPKLPIRRAVDRLRAEMPTTLVILGRP
jgi:hypothetical protein